MKKTLEINKNENKKTEKKKKDSVFYTIYDRYRNFCRQANLSAAECEFDEEFLSIGFSY